MEKFTRTLHGYNPDEVNKFLDEVINEVEQIIESNKKKNEEIRALKEALEKNETDPEIIEKAKKYDDLSETLNNTILLAQNTGEHIRKLAKKERNLILEEAKKDADIIVKNAINRSEKLEEESNRLQKNTIYLKRKLRNTLAEQLKLVDDIEILDENK